MISSLGVQGGTEKNKYAVSLNYYSQDSFYDKEDIRDLLLVSRTTTSLIKLCLPALC